ncbi:MAG: alpha/beta fold hydrolase [Myxococcota bacterium]
MSPRPFERPATVHLPDTPGLPPGSSLDGLWLPPRGGEPRGGAIVAAPHPLMGGSMHSPVVTEVALAASDAGHATHRFDWRGVGASAGRPSGEAADADADTLAALDFMRESVEGPILACGYSWGALAAWRVGLEARRVKRLVLVAPPPALLERERLARAGRRVLVVAGDRDDYVPLDALAALVDGIPGVERIVIPGADHFFMTGLGELGRGVRDWLGGHAAGEGSRPSPDED